MDIIIVDDEPVSVTMLKRLVENKRRRRLHGVGRMIPIW
jgi:hypothetical protein